VQSGKEESEFNLDEIMKQQNDWGKQDWIKNISNGSEIQRLIESEKPIGDTFAGVDIELEGLDRPMGTYGREDVNLESMLVEL
jgi:hypothetical protein